MSTPFRRLACSLVLLLFLGASAFAAAATVSLTSARAKAAREGKVLLVGFTADWCLPCRVMEETTFAHPQVLAYLREHYVSIEVDVENFDGLVIQQQYGVETLPTMLLFSSAGEEVDRINGSVTAEQLLVSLRKNNLPQNRPRTAAPLPSEDWSEPFARSTNVYAQAAFTQGAEEGPSGKTYPSPAAEPSGSAGAPAPTTAGKTRLDAVTPATAPTFDLDAGRRDLKRTANTPFLAAANPIVTPATPPHSPNEEEEDEGESEAGYGTPAQTASPPGPSLIRDAANQAYASNEADHTVAASPDSPTPAALFSLQLGVFASEANALALVERLAATTPHPASISIEITAEQTLYRVLLGRFGTEASAQAMRSDLAAVGTPSLVRTLTVD